MNQRIKSRAYSMSRPTSRWGPMRAIHLSQGRGASHRTNHRWSAFGEINGSDIVTPFSTHCRQWPDVFRHRVRNYKYS